MVDLLASLSLGIAGAKLTLTEKDRLIVHTGDDFFEYLVDSNGFIENARSKKPFPTVPTSNTFINGANVYSGDKEGCIRSYQMS